MNDKKTVLRKCVACNEMKDKRELFRVVRDKDGQVFLDSTGKANGRGAYVCRQDSCIEKDFKKKGFLKAFKVVPPEDLRLLLLKEINR